MQVWSNYSLERVLNQCRNYPTNQCTTLHHTSKCNSPKVSKLKTLKSVEEHPLNILGDIWYLLVENQPAIKRGEFSIKSFFFSWSLAINSLFKKGNTEVPSLFSTNTSYCKFCVHFHQVRSTLCLQVDVVPICAMKISPQFTEVMGPDRQFFARPKRHNSKNHGFYRKPTTTLTSNLIYEYSMSTYHNCIY